MASWKSLCSGAASIRLEPPQREASAPRLPPTSSIVSLVSLSTARIRLQKALHTRLQLYTSHATLSLHFASPARPRVTSASASRTAGMATLLARRALVAALAAPDEPEAPPGSGTNLPKSVLIVATIAAGLSTLLSLWTVWLQLKNYRKITLQRFVVRILMMWVQHDTRSESRWGWRSKRRPRGTGRDL